MKENMDKIDVFNKIVIPEEELRFSFSRSSGAGGQNVNKRETKVILFWNVKESKILTEAQKKKILKKLKNRIDTDGNVILSSETQRSQLQNKQEAMRKLNDLVQEALQPEKKRIPTRPSRSAQKERLREKKMQKKIKESRRRIRPENYSDLLKNQ